MPGTVARLVLLSIALFTAAVVIGAQPRDAHASGATLQLPAVVCNGSSATVSFSWTPVAGSFEQWLDLSLVDNGFEFGTAVSAGPLTSGRNRLEWSGIAPGVVHYWRVNAKMDGGWATSVTGAFVPCGGPALLWGPLTCETNTDASVVFRWAPMATNARLQYLDLGFDPAFAPGTFAAAGPFDAGEDTYAWHSLASSRPYFFRVNALGTDGAWHSTSVGGFTPQCDGSPVVSDQLMGSNDRFVYSRLNIDAPVNVRNVGADGEMGDPAGAWDVVRYEFPGFDGFAGYPGEGGTTTVAAHVDYHPNLFAAFWYLRDARPGDLVDYFRADGVHVQYRVDFAQQIDSTYNLNALIENDGRERLIMLTCDGTFNPETRQYDLRFIVQATRIS